MRKKLLVAILTTIPAITLFSCSDSIAPRDEAKTKPFDGLVRNPATDMQALPPMEVDLSATPGTVTVGSIPFVEGVIADISITGLISLQSEDTAWPIHYSGSLDAAGIGVPYGSCHLDAKLYFTKLVAGSIPSSLPCLIPRTMADYSTRALIGGTITATRGPLPQTNNYCDGPCVYEATGTQHISVRPLAGDLIFKASWSTQSGKVLFIPLSPSNYYVMVRFQEFTNPSGLTLKPLMRSWKQADDTLSGNRTNMLECANGNYQGNPPTYPGLVCDINVKESGTMTSLTRINGVQHTDSITVYCLDSIPLLNHEKVRQGLLAALDSSGVGGPVPFQEIERLYFIVQDTVTPGADPYVKIFPQLPGADGCRAAGWNEPPDFSDRPANTKLIAWGHTHPGLFSFCHDRNGQIIKDENGNDDLLYHPPGVSDGDIFQFEKRNDPNRYPQYVGPVYQYVIDQQRLWIMKPWQLSQAANNLPANHPPWRTGQCAWPKKRV